MKVILFLLVASLLGSNGFWLYREFDRGITQTYRNQELYENANRLAATAVVASEAVRDKSKEEAEALLKRMFPNEQVFEKEGALHTTWLSLALTPQNRVSGVEVDPQTQKQAELKVRSVVGNEIFWPKK